MTDDIIKAVSIISAFLIGCGAGPLWVAQNNYVAECATHENKGRYYGLFASVFQLANIISNSLAGVLIETFSKSVFYAV